MGSVCVKPEKEETQLQNKAFSWENQTKRNPEDYLIENIESKEIIRFPGSVSGQQFIIQNCNNTTVCILDHLNSVTVDECSNCIIILGAVKASVYLRNCVGTVCITACGQFRTRDCRKCQLFIHCATQPIIEASTSMKFGLFQLSYNALSDHLKEAGLNISSQSWTNVFDFTPVQSEQNWSFIEANDTKFVFKTKSRNTESAMSKEGVTWLGKKPESLVLESTV